MTRVAIIVIALLLIACGFLGWKLDHAKKDLAVADSTHFQNERNILIDAAKKANAADREISRAYAYADSIKDASNQRLDNLINFTQRVRFRIVPVTGSPDTVCLAQVHLRDTLIRFQDSTISTLYGERSALQVASDTIKARLERKDRSSEKTIHQLADECYRQSQARQKAENKASRNIVISAGAGATLTGSGLTYGPQVTIGYKIASFRIGGKK